MVGIVGVSDIFCHAELVSASHKINYNNISETLKQFQGDSLVYSKFVHNQPYFILFCLFSENNLKVSYALQTPSRKYFVFGY